MDDLEKLRTAVAPFMRYFDDIRFNLRKQPHPSDAAIEERGERNARVTWAEFYALRNAMTAGQRTDACIDCDGTGRYPSGAACKSCDGSGRVLPGDGIAATTAGQRSES